MTKCNVVFCIGPRNDNDVSGKVQIRIQINNITSTVVSWLCKMLTEKAE